METTFIFNELHERMEYGDREKLEDLIDIIYNKFGASITADILSTFILKYFTHAQADKFVKLMNLCIDKYRDTAFINYPINDFFRLSVFKGSVPLYENYMKRIKGIEQSLEDGKYYLSAMKKLKFVAEKITEESFANYKTAISDKEFFGAEFSGSQNEIILDFGEGSKMYALSEHFNSIISRRDILADLENRIAKINE